VKNIEISPHAHQQMDERGAHETEVIAAVQKGEGEPAQKGRVMYRKNFPFEGQWRGRRYRIKQVAPVVAEEGDKLVVVTVYVFYY
jgi:hypothetical protein